METEINSWQDLHEYLQLLHREASVPDINIIVEAVSRLIFGLELNSEFNHAADFVSKVTAIITTQVRKLLNDVEHVIHFDIKGLGSASNDSSLMKSLKKVNDTYNSEFLPVDINEVAPIGEDIDDKNIDLEGLIQAALSYGFSSTANKGAYINNIDSSFNMRKFDGSILNDGLVKTIPKSKLDDLLLKVEQSINSIRTETPMTQLVKSVFQVKMGTDSKTSVIVGSQTAGIGSNVRLSTYPMTLDGCLYVPVNSTVGIASDVPVLRATSRKSRQAEIITRAIEPVNPMEVEFQAQYDDDFDTGPWLDDSLTEHPPVPGSDVRASSAGSIETMYRNEDEDFDLPTYSSTTIGGDIAGSAIAYSSASTVSGEPTDGSNAARPGLRARRREVNFSQPNLPLHRALSNIKRSRGNRFKPVLIPSAEYTPRTRASLDFPTLAITSLPASIGAAALHRDPEQLALRALRGAEEDLKSKTAAVARKGSQKRAGAGVGTREATDESSAGLLKLEASVAAQEQSWRHTLVSPVSQFQWLTSPATAAPAAPSAGGKTSGSSAGSSVSMAPSELVHRVIRLWSIGISAASSITEEADRAIEDICDGAAARPRSLEHLSSFDLVRNKNDAFGVTRRSNDMNLLLQNAFQASRALAAASASIQASKDTVDADIKVDTGLRVSSSEPLREEDDLDPLDYYSADLDDPFDDQPMGDPDMGSHPVDYTLDETQYAINPNDSQLGLHLDVPRAASRNKFLNPLGGNADETMNTTVPAGSNRPTAATKASVALLQLLPEDPLPILSFFERMLDSTLAETAGAALAEADLGVTSSRWAVSDALQANARRLENLLPVSARAGDDALLPLTADADAATPLNKRKRNRSSAGVRLSRLQEELEQRNLRFAHQHSAGDVQKVAEEFHAHVVEANRLKAKRRKFSMFTYGKELLQSFFNSEEIAPLKSGRKSNEDTPLPLAPVEGGAPRQLDFEQMLTKQLADNSSTVERFEVARYFSSLLQLINKGNLKVDVRPLVTRVGGEETTYIPFSQGRPRRGNNSTNVDSSSHSGSAHSMRSDRMSSGETVVNGKRIFLVDDGANTQEDIHAITDDRMSERESVVIGTETYYKESVSLPSQPMRLSLISTTHNPSTYINEMPPDSIEEPVVPTGSNEQSNLDIDSSSGRQHASGNHGDDDDDLDEESTHSRSSRGRGRGRGATRGQSGRGSRGRPAGRGRQ